MIAHLVVSLLGFTSPLVNTRVGRPSAVTMSAQNDVKNVVAAAGVAAALTAIPASSMAAPCAGSFLCPVKDEAYVKPVDLGDEPNKLKVGFRGLGLTTGIRSKAPAKKEFKAPMGAEVFKGAIAVKAK